MKRLLLLALILIPVASAIQMSPASTHLTTQESFDIRLINDDSSAHNFRLSVQGALAEHLSLSADSFSLQPQQSRQVTVTVDRPISLEPGSYESLIVAEQEVPSSSRTVATTPSVAHRIVFVQPREGQWLSSRLSTSSVNIGAPASFNLHVQNIGMQTVRDIQADIQILQGQEVLHQQAFSIQELQAATQNRLSTQWTPTQPGEYEIQTTTQYAGKSLQTSDRLRAGERGLEILNITHQQLEETTRIQIQLKNPYNQPYPHIDATVRTDKASAQTSPISLQPAEEGVLIAFLEATYNSSTIADITINYPPNTVRTQYVIEQEQSEERFPWLITAGILLLIILIYLRLSQLSKRGEHGKK